MAEELRLAISHRSTNESKLNKMYKSRVLAIALKYIRGMPQRTINNKIRLLLRHLEIGTPSSWLR